MNKVGRPRLPKGEGKTALVMVRLDRSQRAVAENLAKQRGMSLSEFIRECIQTNIDFYLQCPEWWKE